MLTAVILISFLFLALALSNISSYQRSRRAKKLKKIASEFRAKHGIISVEGIDINLPMPNYYKDITPKKKAQKAYKWELHESF